MSEMRVPSPSPTIPGYNRRAAEQLIRHVRAGRYCALLGPRFAGKSQLLHFVQAELGRSPAHTCVYIDLQEVEISTQTGFFASLVDAVARCVMEKTDCKVSASPVGVISGVVFRGFLENALVSVARDLVLVIDHLEAVPNDLLQALLTSLRAVYMDQQLYEHRLVAVVSGALSLATLTVGESSPFRGIAQRVLVGDLAEADNQALIAEHLRVNDIQASSPARAWLLRAARGDPFLIAMICGQCTRTVGGRPSRKLTVATVKRLVREFVRDRAPNYPPLQEAIQLVEESPDLLRCVLLLLERDAVPRRELPLPLSPDLDPLYLTGLVREVDGDSYTFRNEIYRQALDHHFDPGRVGHVLTMAGRWDLAIDYLEHSVREGREEYRSELLAATINSIYAAQDTKRTAYYLARGLLAAFGVQEACIYYLSAQKDALSQVERLGPTPEGALPVAQVISVDADCLEARVYREGRYFRRYDEGAGRTVLAVPLLVPGGGPIGVVTAYDYLTGHELARQRERIIQLMGYLNQAARAVQEVRSREFQDLRIQDQDVQLQEKTRQLSLLHRISTLVQSMTDLDKMLNLVLTGITAYYGLGFNRAWLFVLDSEHAHLTGRMAIGDFTHEEAHRSWERAAQDSFDEYVRRLLAGDALESTPVDEPTRELCIPISEPSEDLFSRAVFKRRVFGWTASSAGPSTLPPDFQQRFDPEAVIVAPLLAQGECLGIAVVDNKFSPRAYTTADEEILVTFANQAATAIVSVRQRQQEQRRRELAETMRDISRVIGGSLELKEVFKLILEQMARVLPYDTASVQLLSPDGNELEITASRGFDDPVSVNALAFPLEGDYPNVRVWRSQKPLRYADVHDLFPHFAEPRYHATRVHGWLGVPLMVGGEAIGVLTLDSFTAGTYTPEHESLAMIFAAQAAVAIQNARLFASAQRRIRDLEIVNDVAQIVNTRLDTRDLLQVIVSQIAKHLNCTHCTFFFPQRVDGELMLVPRVTYGVHQEQVQQLLTRRFRPGEGLAGWVFQHGTSLVLPDARQDSRFASARRNRDQPRSMLVAPVKVGDRTIGVISADQDTFGWFNESDRRLVDALAQHAGIAIERSAALELLHDVGRRIISAQRVDDILQQIVSGAIRLTNTTSGVIYLVSEDGQSIVRSYQHPPDFDHPPPRIGGQEGLTWQVVRTGQELIFPDIRQDTRVNPALRDRGVRSMIAVPLKLDGQEVLGVLYLNDAHRRDFTETEISLLSTLATQAAIAIVNARLLQNTSAALQKRVAEMETLQQINDAITSTLDLNEVLEMILDRAIELTGAIQGAVQLVSEDGQALELAMARGPVLIPIGKRLGLSDSVTGKAVQEGRTYRISDLQSPEWRHFYRDHMPGIRSELAVPMRFEDRVVGVINIASADVDAFNQDDEHLLEGLAKQAAIVIRNATLYQAVRRRSQHWQALCEASKAIAAGFTTERRRVLDHIAELAVERITGVAGPKAAWGAILLYDEAAKALQFESVHPLRPELEARLGERWPLDRGTAPGGRIGITGRAVLSRRLQRVADVHADPDYLAFNPATRSELDVPLLDGDDVIGVLSVESDRSSAFDENDEQALQGLAELAVIAVKNAAQTEKLSRINAVALMGAWGADIVHDVNREVGAIRRASFLLQQHPDLPPEFCEQLRNIDQYAAALALPELPEQPLEPGRALEMRDAPLLDEVVRTEVERIRPAYPHVSWQFELKSAGVQVAIHEQWLRRLLRHLIHNAGRAVQSDVEPGLVTVRTAVQGAMSEVQVEDTGDGIPSEIVPLLFRRPVPHASRQPGRGLLLVRFLAEQYGGDAKLLWNRPGQGACFAFNIPLAQSAAGF